jgi:chromosome segregation ATPase
LCHVTTLFLEAYRFVSHPRELEESESTRTALASQQEQLQAQLEEAQTLLRTQREELESQLTAANKQCGKMEGYLTAARVEAAKGAEDLRAAKEEAERGAQEVQLSRTALTAGAGEVESQLIAARCIGEEQAVLLRQGQARVVEMECQLAEAQGMTQQLQLDKTELLANLESRRIESEAIAEQAGIEVEGVNQRLVVAEARVKVRLFL